MEVESCETASMMTCPARQFHSKLTESNPIVGDGNLWMEESTHTYHYKLGTVRISATGLLKKYFPEFDGAAIVEANFDNWKRSKSSKYGLLIQYLMHVEGKDEAFCKRAILDAWAANGKLAAEEGTAMHADFQFIAEGLPPPQGETPEVRQFRPWIAAFCDKYHLKIYRAEWNIVFTDERDRPVVAGQIDLVLQSVHNKDEFWCVDFKRKDPQPSRAGGKLVRLGDDKPSFFDEGFGKAPLDRVPATDFGKYSCQQNLYGYIAATQYGVDFRDRMFLLQVHPSLPEPHCIGVQRLDAEMEALFAKEMAEFVKLF